MARHVRWRRSYWHNRRCAFLKANKTKRHGARNPDAQITVIQKNIKKGKSKERHDKYKVAKTVREFLALGDTVDDLRADFYKRLVVYGNTADESPPKKPRSGNTPPRPPPGNTAPKNVVMAYRDSRQSKIGMMHWYLPNWLRVPRLRDAISTTPRATPHVLLPAETWQVEMRAVDFINQGAVRSEWIAELESWATRLGFAFTFTDNATTRQAGCQCGPVAAWAACQMKTAEPGAGGFVTVDLSGVESYNARVAGYRHMPRSQ